ncbi:uncharacterized protein LTR77_007584 [Saxophila tyrrhenica]|uniref:Uncharacterized protein n=1 Tax=Saxophila tyrrhenica TaxID=1690608 RepID=A0AAV9P599_9PEZI|nr:hypothetical protein LTR77_007584 [Saxophila tyrrhenica]
MSKSVSSPTARLLQTSRLFSLPRPLPAPINDTLTSTGTYRASDTATLPYPTHQAITTPAASLHRGDFGLKRSLPARTTRNTSTPVVRIKAQDTYEHITDFASSADVVVGQRKFGEMGVPFVQKLPKKDSKAGPPTEPRSVFENWIDNTDPEAKMPVERRGKAGMGSFARAGMEMREPKTMQRWKFAGPWVPGMQEGEFARWLERNIDRRKGEWREFVRGKEADSRMAEAQRQAREQGEPLSGADIARLRVELRPTDEQLTEIEKDLRDTHISDRLSSNLTALIQEFFDLPNLYYPGRNSSPNTATARMDSYLKKFQAATDVDEGPPTTHPAAGLSHLRSSAIMPNHPLYGPQAYGTPVEARVVRPRRTTAGLNEHQARIGVGGFVATDTESDTKPPAQQKGREKAVSEASRMTGQLDEDLEGGNKVWVQPGTAHVDERGRVNLKVGRAEPEALAVKRGGEELGRIMQAKRASRAVEQGTAGLRGPGGRPFGFGGGFRGQSLVARSSSYTFILVELLLALEAKTLQDRRICKPDVPLQLHNAAAGPQDWTSSDWAYPRDDE